MKLLFYFNFFPDFIQLNSHIHNYICTFSLFNTLSFYSNKFKNFTFVPTFKSKYENEVNRMRFDEE